MDTNAKSAARRLYLVGDHDAAIEFLQRTLAADPDDGACWELLGVLLRGQGKFSEAMSTLARATTLTPISAGGQLLSRLTPRQISGIECANCLRKITGLFQLVGDELRSEVCRSRLEELSSP